MELTYPGSDLPCNGYYESIIGVRPASIGFRPAPPEAICRVVVELATLRLNLQQLIMAICRRHKASRFRYKRHLEASASGNAHVLVVDLEKAMTDRGYEALRAAGTPVVGGDLDW